MGVLYTVASDGKTVATNSTLEEVGAAMSAGGQLLNPDGSLMHTIEFMGGLLVGKYELPMNVILYDAWFPQQKELLQPLWERHSLATPPQAIIDLPTVDPSTIGQSSSLLPILGIGLAAFLLLRK